MRDRELIEADRRIDTAFTTDSNTHDVLIIEILLDMRELLVDVKGQLES